MGINVFTASGRCGQDMEVRYTHAGKAIGQFSLPVETGYGDNKKTAWVTCKIFGDRAEKLAQYVRKGSLVTVTGAFSLDEWEKDGVKHSKPCILVNDVQLPPNQQQGEPSQQQTQQSMQSQGGYARQANQSQPAQPAYNEPPMDFNDNVHW